MFYCDFELAMIPANPKKLNMKASLKPGRSQRVDLSVGGLDLALEHLLFCGCARRCQAYVLVAAAEGSIPSNHSGG
jgi:hypothetical protein